MFGPEKDSHDLTTAAAPRAPAHSHSRGRTCLRGGRLGPLQGTPSPTVLGHRTAAAALRSEADQLLTAS